MRKKQLVKRVDKIVEKALDIMAYEKSANKSVRKIEKQKKKLVKLIDDFSEK